MWLLNSKTAELRHFPSSKDVRYAIVSHVWQQEPKEQTFHEVRAILAQCKEAGTDPMPHLSRKIRDCCAMAAQAGYDWLWLDAACIDHNSSAELSEAINSMFTWYADAQVCFAYLHDVGDDEDPSAEGSAFRCSVWHTRGWTLQELLAPACVIFLSKTWHTLGSKHSLVVALSEVSGIRREVLTRERTDWLEGVSVAERMSWAAHRRTTRVEDRAYSLMGIFGINMPTIYGEGPRAFMRLQEEILQRIPDQSIFAWGRIHPDLKGALDGLLGRSADEEQLATDDAPTGLEDLLAPSPADFADSAGIKTLSMQDLATRFGIRAKVPQYTLTSYGMLVQLPLSSDNLLAIGDTQAPDKEGAPVEAPGAEASDAPSLYAAALACTDKHQTLILLLLRPIQGRTSPQYAVGAYIGSSAHADRRYYRAVLLSGIPGANRTNQARAQRYNLSSDAFPLKELYVRHAHATLLLGQALHSPEMQEAEAGRVLYTFHIPQWALKRLEARHSLVVRPASTDGLILRVPYDIRTGKLEHATASAQFLDISRQELVTVRIGVGCSCFDSPSSPDVPADGSAIGQCWIDAHVAPVAAPGYAQSYGEPLTLGAGAPPAECGAGRAHMRNAKGKGKGNGRQGTSEKLVVAFDALGGRLQVRVEPRVGFEPIGSAVAGSYSITLDVKDADEDLAPSGSDAVADLPDTQPVYSDTREPEADSPDQPPADEDMDEADAGAYPSRHSERRFAPSASWVGMLAKMFLPPR